MESKKNNKGLIIALIVAIVVLVGCVGFDIYLNILPELSPHKTVETVTKEEVTITDEGIAKSVDKVYDATVIVKDYNGSSITGWGSGFVYKTDDKYGYILTNHHVIDGAKTVIIEYRDDTNAEATIIDSNE